MAAIDKGILDGIRVLDFTAYVAGPYATRLMADMGAEVIKVEAPEGDLLRATPPRRQGRSAYYGQLNAGKLSLVLNLKRPAAQALARDLAARSDVVVENSRPGVMARLGLDHASLKAVKADLVYCSISGYGQSGPGAGRAAYAPIMHAGTGHDLALMGYEPTLAKPARARIPYADYFAGIHALAAINAALFHRARSGQGQHIDLSLLDCMHSVLAYEYQRAQFPGERTPPIFGPLSTKDGYFMVAPVSAGNFADLCRAVGHPEWQSDPRYADAGSRMLNWDALMADLEAWTLQRSAAECEVIVTAAGCPCTRYRRIEESIEDEHVRARGQLAEVADGSGKFRVANSPLRFEPLRAVVRPWIAELGQHTEPVLAKVLGLAPAAIAELRAAGAFGG